MVEVIDRFSGDFMFLSNFSKDQVVLPKGTLFPSGGKLVEDISFHTAEAAFQAGKCGSYSDVVKFSQVEDPAVSKKLGRSVSLIPNWDVAKLGFMLTVLEGKFREGTAALDLLLDTKDTPLIEGNFWHDQIWGSCFCTEHKATPGDNMLGMLLEHVRGKNLSERL